MNKVYLDNAATTRISDEVIDIMSFAMKNYYGNPSSTHSIGQKAKTLMEEVRRKIAEYLRVNPSEIIFTSCGTESNNMIIKSCVEHLGVQRIISSPIEHSCVAETCMEMKLHKHIELTYIKPNNKGDIDLNVLEELLKSSDKKTLVSLMHANNEIGNLLDLEKTAKICKENKALFHSDTVQTIAHIDMDFSKISIDFASCSAHKFHGPKGSGFTFIRKFTGLKPVITGGSQERNMRAGTENLIGILGMGKAMEIAIENMSKFPTHIQSIKNYTIEKLQREIQDIKFNGRSNEEKRSLYTILNISLPFKNPLIGLQLDMKGVAISQGSACSSGAHKRSMVTAMIQSDEEIDTSTSLRISFSHYTTKNEIDFFVNALKEIIQKN